MGTSLDYALTGPSKVLTLTWLERRWPPGNDTFLTRVSHIRAQRKRIHISVGPLRNYPSLIVLPHLLVYSDTPHNEITRRTIQKKQYVGSGSHSDMLVRRLSAQITHHDVFILRSTSPRPGFPLLACESYHWFCPKLVSANELPHLQGFIR